MTLLQIVTVQWIVHWSLNQVTGRYSFPDRRGYDRLQHRFVWILPLTSEYLLPVNGSVISSNARMRAMYVFAILNLFKIGGSLLSSTSVEISSTLEEG